MRYFLLNIVWGIQVRRPWHCETMPGSKTSRFRKCNVAKSLRFPRRALPEGILSLYAVFLLNIVWGIQCQILMVSVWFWMSPKQRNLIT